MRLCDLHGAFKLIQHLAMLLRKLSRDSGERSYGTTQSTALSCFTVGTEMLAHPVLKYASSANSAEGMSGCGCLQSELSDCFSDLSLEDLFLLGNGLDPVRQ